MKVYKFKCLKCKAKTQSNSAIGVFKEGCPLCRSKKIEVIGYGEEEESEWEK